VGAGHPIRHIPTPLESFMAKPEEQTLIFETVQGDVAFTFTNPAQINQAWGSIASQVAGAGAMGEHSSANGVFISQPRDGVGNVSKEDARFQPDGIDGQANNSLADGAQGLHGTFQAARLGDPNLPPGSVESEIGPFFPEVNGQLGFEIVSPSSFDFLL
jgi:hypothetical protein